MTVHEMWNQAKRNNNLPSEWPTWPEFRTWVNNNRYKAEYGYKGEFNPEGCLRAIPVAGIDMSSLPDKTVYKADFNSLMRMKLEELKELASKLGIDTTETSTKKEISTLIVERGQG